MLKVQKLDHLFDFFACLQLRSSDPSCEKQVLPEIAATLGVAANQKVLQDRCKFEQFNILKCSRDSQCGDFMGGMVGESERTRGTGVINRSSRWVVDSADQVKHGGLPCAIGPNQGEHFAGLNFKADVFDGEHTTKADAQILG